MITPDFVAKIALKTEIEGYTEGIIEILFPDNIEEWNNKKSNKWIAENNKRMNAVCEFLNENNL